MTLTGDDARKYLRRFPAQRPATVALNFAMVLAGNAIVLYLLAIGELRAAHLIALVIAETVLLIAVAWALQRCVPKSDWLEPPRSWRQNLPVIVFVLIWLSGAYGITLFVVDGWEDFFDLTRSPGAWIESRLYLPLAYTLLLALVHGLADLRHYRQRGGPFLSEVGHDAMARYLTLILGGLPFVMPFFAVVIGGFKGLEYVVGKLRVDLQKAVLAAAVMLIIGSASLQLVEYLVTSGVRGWAIGFVFAKLIAEALVVCIPLVMVRVIAEETAASAAATKPKAR
jgi:hypothetical protein